MKLIGKHFYLDMNYPCEITEHYSGYDLGLIEEEAERFLGITIKYPSAENCYQAKKILYADISVDEKINYLVKLSQISPRDAKHLIKSVPIFENKWNENKINEMIEVIYQKFGNYELASKLMAEKGAIIVENDIGETFWGMCKNEGKNHLGKILEMEREYRLQQYANDDKCLIPFKSTEVIDNHCYVKNRFILEKDRTVYNYTEIISDKSRGKEIIITKWNKDDEFYARKTTFSTCELFEDNLSFEKVEQEFENINNIYELNEELTK